MTEEHVDLVVDGQRVAAPAGATVAAALLNAGVAAFRQSTNGSPRGPVCGMGICYECRVTIDGVDHQRACMRVVADGMQIETATTNAG